jgi:hypothetical protein
MDIQARALVLHSTVVLLVGLILGAPYGSAINQKAPERVVQAWRLVHGTLPMGASIGLAVAAVLSSLRVGATMKWLLAWSWIVSNYSFTLSLTVAAIVGHRGLTMDRPLANRVVFVGNTIGAGTSLAGALVLLYAAYISLN